MSTGVAAFEHVYERSDHPMLIVTAAAAGEPAGCLVGFHSRVGIAPPRGLICLSKENKTREVAREAGTLVVHHLEPHHMDLARLFGERSGHEVDKFARCRWEEGPHGVPRLSEVDHWWAGRVLRRIDFGDHEGFLLAPFAGHSRPRIVPLLSGATNELEAGHPR